MHHLTPLLSLPTFTALWLTILDFMDKYMHADNSDLLFEAIPESLKNMLLVMDSAKVFDSPDGRSQLWTITWDRIGTFLPNMKDELFKDLAEVPQQPVPSAPPEPLPEKESPIEIIPPMPPVLQQTIEAPRSSIILQPPNSEGQNVSTPLFTHLGQVC